MIGVAAMAQRGVAADALARHLHAAIARVREDMEKVEFWADAVSGFAEPVPEYDAKDVTIWLPSEQARTISSARRDGARRRDVAPKRSGKRRAV